MAPTPENQDWRDIAAQASKEMDGKKLTILVQQLCSALDEIHKPQSAHDQNSSTVRDVSQLRKPTANS
jgi:hypothetical protein